MPRKSRPETVTLMETAPTFAEPTIDSLQAQLAAKDAQHEQLIDMIVELREKVDAQSEQAPAAPTANTEGAKLDVELAALIEEFKDYPQIHVFEQRAVLGTDASMDIRLKGDPDVLADKTGATCTWKLRYFNLAKEGRGQAAVREGYLQVTWDELQDRQMVVGGDATKPYVNRGDRGMEVLYKIPLKLFNYKKRRDAARAAGKLSTETGVRDHVANGVATLAGREGMNADQAGTTVQDRFSVTVTPMPTERVTF